MKSIDCTKCPQQSYCCQEGVSLDLEEAKKILPLGLSGEFHCLAVDKDFPSGYRVDTSLGSDSCSFLTAQGLCSIHKISYALKPTPCKDFPHDAEEEDGLSVDVPQLCLLHKLDLENQTREIGKS